MIKLRRGSHCATYRLTTVYLDFLDRCSKLCHTLNRLLNVLVKPQYYLSAKTDVDARRVSIADTSIMMQCMNCYTHYKSV